METKKVYFNDELEPIQLKKQNENKLIRLYFIWYLLLGPIIMGILLVALQPNFEKYYEFLYFALLVIILCAALKIASPIINKSIVQFKRLGLKVWKSIFSNLFFLLLANIVVGAMISFITNTSDSANEKALNSEAETMPILTLFLALVFAPIVEELVFRSAIFVRIRKKSGFIKAALLSSFAFGFIHVAISLISGNFIDIPYIAVYMSIGFILARCYEKNGTVVATMILHFLNNLLASLPMFY